MNPIKTTKLRKSCAEDLNKARARSGSATRDDYSSQKNGRFIRVCIYKRWNEESRRDVADGLGPHSVWRAAHAAYKIQANKPCQGGHVSPSPFSRFGNRLSEAQTNHIRSSHV